MLGPLGRCYQKVKVHNVDLGQEWRMARPSTWFIASGLMVDGDDAVVLAKLFSWPVKAWRQGLAPTPRCR